MLEGESSTIGLAVFWLSHSFLMGGGVTCSESLEAETDLGSSASSLFPSFGSWLPVGNTHSTLPLHLVGLGSVCVCIGE